MRSVSLRTLYSELLEHAADSSMSPALQRLLRQIRQELKASEDDLAELPLSVWWTRYAGLSRFIEQ